MFIDVSVPKWRILHLNAAAQTKLKLYDIEVPQCSDQDGSLLWEVFRPNSNTAGVNPEAPWESFAEDIQHGRKFEVTSARFNSNHSHNSAPSPIFSLTFRYGRFSEGPTGDRHVSPHYRWLPVWPSADMQEKGLPSLPMSNVMVGPWQG